MGVLGAEPTSGKTKSPHCDLDVTSYSMAAGGIATGPSSLMLWMYWGGVWRPLLWGGTVWVL